MRIFKLTGGCEGEDVFLLLRSKTRGKWGCRGARWSPFIDAGRPPLNEQVDVLHVKDQCAPTIYMQSWLAQWILSH